MKNFLACVLVAVVVVGMMCGVFALGFEASDRYTLRNCEVIEIENDVITVVDCDGLLWSFYGEDFQKGDTVDLVMKGANTKTLNDDVILKVK